MIIAIDGPAGSGKSTLAKLISNELGLIYLDTGAMYRLVTLKVLNEKIDFEILKNITELEIGDEKSYSLEELEVINKIKEILEKLNINIEKNKFYLDNVDISEEIRKPIVSENVSNIAKIKEIREKMVKLQREFSKSKDIILDGRDIGTVVFPNADVKIFLVADATERANRRYKELIEKGENVSLEEILENIVNRDKIDSTRKEAPLKKAKDAIEIDTTSKGIERVKKEIDIFDITSNVLVNKDSVKFSVTGDGEVREVKSENGKISIDLYKNVKYSISLIRSMENPFKMDGFKFILGDDGKAKILMNKSRIV